MENVIDVLRARGFVQEVSDEAGLRERAQHPITLYNGIDPTAGSLHTGHLVPIMMLSWFQRCGHRPVALIGGGTAMVGDPTGRTTSRAMLSEADIDGNVEAIRAQVARFLDFNDGAALVLNNADWLRPLPFIAFMREVGSRFSVNDLLRLEAYRTRLEAGGLSFLEFTYALMQSYDFLHLYQNFDCILQVGGSDQWGNSIAGADLIRRVTGGEAFVLTAPLLLASGGAKMGKTAGNAIWLDPGMTSPYEYYQYWRNTADADVERRLAIYTFLPMDDVRRLGGLHGVELNQAKEVLAFEATAIAHGSDAAESARAAARALFGGGGDRADVPCVRIDRALFERGLPVSELFKLAGLVDSANDARRQIQQGGLSLNGSRISDAALRVDESFETQGELLLSRGRKRHVRVEMR